MAVATGGVVFDATNLNVGGGVQVATAFFADLLDEYMWRVYSDEFPWLDNAEFRCSPRVRENLDPLLTKWAVERLERRLGGRAILTFSVFGPRYRRPATRFHVCGFADVTSIYPWPNVLPNLTLKQRVRKILSLMSFRSPDVLVVETDAVKDRLAMIKGMPHRVEVVSNTVNPVFANQAVWEPREFEAGHVDLLYVGRAYPHKNHDFLGDLGQALELNHGIRATFWVTLKEEEWVDRTDTFRRYAHNLGELDVSQLPDVYRRVDAVVFPSLLECFSATPLESMAMGVPLFASDLDFNRVACGSGANYFDPISPTDAAGQIASALSAPERLLQVRDEGLARMSDAPTSSDRTRRYLQIIDQMLVNS